MSDDCSAEHPTLWCPPFGAPPRLTARRSSFFALYPTPDHRRSVLKTHEQAASADDVEDLMTGDHAADAAALKEMMADPLRAPVEPGHVRVSWLTVIAPPPPHIQLTHAHARVHRDATTGGPP